MNDKTDNSSTVSMFQEGTQTQIINSENITISEEEMLLGDKEESYKDSSLKGEISRSPSRSSVQLESERPSDSDLDTERMRRRKQEKKRKYNEKMKAKVREEKERKRLEKERENAEQRPGVSGRYPEQGSSRTGRTPHGDLPTLKDSSRKGRTFHKDFPTLEDANRYQARSRGASRPTKRGPGARDAARRAGKASRYNINLPRAPRSVLEAERREYEEREEGERNSNMTSKRPRGTSGTPPSGELPPKKVNRDPAPSGKSPLTRKAVIPEAEMSARRPGGKEQTAGRAEPESSEPKGPTPRTFGDVVKGKALQVVVLSNRPGGNIMADEGAQLREHLNDFSFEAMGGMNYENSGITLRYEKAGIVDNGWLLISCFDKETKDWTLAHWNPPSSKEELTFKVYSASDAPWPVRIGINLRVEKKPDFQRICLELHHRSRMPGTQEWRLDCITGEPGNWRVVAWVPGVQSRL